MEKVKVINLNTMVVKEIEKNLVADYLATKEYIVYQEKPIVKENVKPIRKNVK